MKHCRLVYLDVDGNPSSIYYDTLKKHGEEAAARAYVSYMLGTGVKFSQSQKFGRTPVEDIIKEWIGDIERYMKDERPFKRRSFK